MNKEMFYTGIYMLLAPFIVYAIIASAIALINSGIDFITLTAGICGVAYFGVALFLIVKGSKEK